MYNILFSEIANFQINEFINSYKNTFLSRFIDTWIYDEELIISSYINISETLKDKIYLNNWDIKYYFSKKIVQELFFEFEILELNEVFDKHNKINWDIGINWFIDLVAKKAK